MSQRPPSHTVTETRDWAKIVLAAGIALTFVILALRGDVSGSALIAALDRVLAGPDTSCGGHTAAAKC